ncbi:MAG: ECF transporter S component [Nitrososphaerales archaeon]
MKARLTPAMIGLLAVLIALVAVFTLVPRVPVPATGGYANLSSVAITFTSLVFGPFVGAVAGGIGTAIADLLGGFLPFAPLSLIAHGLEGLLIGLLGRGQRSVWRMIAAWLAGSLAMMAVYFVGESLLLTGPAAALAEVPFNAFQAALGALVGIPLVLAVRRAYPAVDRLGRRQTWTE